MFIESYRQTAPDDANLVVMDMDPITPYGRAGVPGTYVVIPENKGYAYACNFAAARTDGEIIALFNSDIILLEGTIEKCANALRENPKWGVVGPLQYDSQGMITHAGIFGTLEQPKHRQWRRRTAAHVRDVREAVTVAGSAYFVKRTVWDELTQCEIYRSLYPDAEGAFLPTWLYYEETWCSYHAQAHGHEVYYFGEAECIHEWHGTIGRHGGDQAIGDAKAQFRAMCDTHGILHD